MRSVVPPRREGAERDGPGADTDAEREALFWTTCLPLRALLAFCAAAAEGEGARLVTAGIAVYYAAWGVGMAANFVRSGWAERRAAAAGREGDGEGEAAAEAARRAHKLRHGNFGGLVWWQRLRPVHAVLLIAFSATALPPLALPFPSSFFLLLDFAVACVSGGTYFSLRRKGKASACPFFALPSLPPFS